MPLVILIVVLWLLSVVGFMLFLIVGAGLLVGWVTNEFLGLFDIDESARWVISGVVAILVVGGWLFANLGGQGVLILLVCSAIFIFILSCT